MSLRIDTIALRRDPAGIVVYPARGPTQVIAQVERPLQDIERGDRLLARAEGGRRARPRGWVG